MPRGRTKYHAALLDWQRRYFASLMRKHRHDAAAAAKSIGMNRTHLYSLLKTVGYKKPPPERPRFVNIGGVPLQVILPAASRRPVRSPRPPGW